MKRKMMTVVAGAVLATTAYASTAFAASPVYPVGSSSHVNVYVNDELLQVDQTAVIQGGRTLVPLRAIFEALGADIQWDNATQTVTATKDDLTMKLQINANHASVNGQDVALDVPATMINYRTMVPVRFVSETLGAKVYWDAGTNSVFAAKHSDTSLSATSQYVASIATPLSDFVTDSAQSDDIYKNYYNKTISYSTFRSQYDANLLKLRTEIDQIKAGTPGSDPTAQKFALRYSQVFEEGYDMLQLRGQGVTSTGINTTTMVNVLAQMGAFNRDLKAFETEFSDLYQSSSN